MGSNSIGQHSIGIPESSWSLHAPSLSSYLHSQCGKESFKFKQWKKLPNMEQPGVGKAHSEVEPENVHT